MVAGARGSSARSSASDDRSASRAARSARIAQAYPDRVEVRGRDLTGDLMGRLTFTEYFHLLLTGDEPTDDQRFFLDLLLVAIAEHGMMPTNVAARMTLAADPGSLQGRGRRGDPRRRAGRARHVRGVRAAARGGAGGESPPGREPDVVARDVARSDRARPAARCPGFGHPVHRPRRPARRADPRARRRARRQRRARRLARASATRSPRSGASRCR